jgi:hypothetical protein
MGKTFSGRLRMANPCLLTKLAAQEWKMEALARDLAALMGQMCRDEARMICHGCRKRA